MWHNISKEFEIMKKILLSSFVILAIGTVSFAYTLKETNIYPNIFILKFAKCAPYSYTQPLPNGKYVTRTIARTDIPKICTYTETYADKQYTCTLHESDIVPLIKPMMHDRQGIDTEKLLDKLRNNPEKCKLN